MMKMKKKHKQSLALGICVVLLVSFAFIMETIIGKRQTKIIIESNSEVSEYFEFKIDTNDSSFYILEGVSFSKIYSGMAISNTDYDIIIQNCDFSSGLPEIWTDMGSIYSGISLDRCANVRIINCNISNFQHCGLFIHHCSNISIINSTFVGNIQSNIYLGVCDNVTIDNSIFSYSRQGIWGSENQNILIQDCRISNMSQYGISFSYSDGINVLYNQYGNIQLENYRFSNCTNLNDVE